MNGIYPNGRLGDAIRSETGKANALRATDWLCLGAAPTFALMALLALVLGGGEPQILCSAAEHTSPSSGMALMYLLMSTFHLAPWFQLISKQPTAD